MLTQEDPVPDDGGEGGVREGAREEGRYMYMYTQTWEGGRIT